MTCQAHPLTFFGTTPVALRALVLCLAGRMLLAAEIEIEKADLVETKPRVAAHDSAASNTRIIQEAIDAAAPGDTVVLPPGNFLVNMIVVKNKRAISLRGAGAGRTTLRRNAERWDNDSQGVFQGLALLFVVEVADFNLGELTLDGNAHHMEIKGRGQFGPDRTIVAGTPQFPDCDPAGPGMNTVAIERATNVEVHDAEFRDGFRWSVFFGQVKGLDFHDNRITTGRLYSAWRAHTDSPNGVLHCHQSQDGVHLVNCVDARIQWNTIRSEDSAIAIEANPEWNWFRFPGEATPNRGTERIHVLNNDIATNSSAHQDRLILGKGLARKWVGQGCVDIFYNERWDPSGKIAQRGTNALIRDIVVSGNRLSNARHGVRAGVFRNANAYDASSPNHRVRGLAVVSNNATEKAGVGHNIVGGITAITKDTLHPDSGARHGGVAVLIHHADDVRIEDNKISDVHGGTGVELVDVTMFKVLRNRISGIHGTILADQNPWDGGEGIRVWNAPGIVKYDAQGFEITGNEILGTSSYAIFVTDTANGTCTRVTNKTSRWKPWPGFEQRGIFLRDCVNIRE